MQLDDFLGSLETRKAVLLATSFDDYAWRKDRRVLTIQAPEGLGVPADVVRGTGISTDALHFLNIYSKFSQPATIAEFLEVLSGMNKDFKAIDEYTKYHLTMYGTSFTQMGIMQSLVDLGDAGSVGGSKVVFLPVFSVKVEKFNVIKYVLRNYSVVDGGLRGDSYLSLSVSEGRKAVRGENAESESMTT